MTGHRKTIPEPLGVSVMKKESEDRATLGKYLPYYIGQVIKKGYSLEETEVGEIGDNFLHREPCILGLLATGNDQFTGPE